MNSPRKRPGLLFTLVGPAGAGKNRLIKHILGQTSLTQLPTATTRPIRAGEQEGREHLYVSREEFQRMIDQGELLEYQVIHGNLYGMPRAAVERALDSGQSIIADIEVYGAAHAREAYPENVISIFIQPPSIGTLIERMRERRETEAEIGKRLLRVPMELAYARDCSYIVLNDSFEHAAQLLQRIVETELSGAGKTDDGDQLIVYRYRYDAKIIPVFREEALHRASPQHDLIAAFGANDLPHKVALRCMQDELGVQPRETALLLSDRKDGDYLPPVALEYNRDENGEHVTYDYLYCLDERIDAPAGWAWTSIETLPETLRPLAFECAT